MPEETERTFDSSSNGIVAVHNCAVINPQCKNIPNNLHAKLKRRICGAITKVTSVTSKVAH